MRSAGGAGPAYSWRTGKAGDLLVTVEVAVPARLDNGATEALRSYAEATKSFNPRADLLGGSR